MCNVVYSLFVRHHNSQSYTDIAKITFCVSSFVSIKHIIQIKEPPNILRHSSLKNVNIKLKIYKAELIFSTIKKRTLYFLVNYQLFDNSLSYIH